MMYKMQTQEEMLARLRKIEGILVQVQLDVAYAKADTPSAKLVAECAKWKERSLKSEQDADYWSRKYREEREKRT